MTTEHERRERVIRLLEVNVQTELAIQCQAFGLGLSEEQIENLTAAVTSGLLYAFAIDWSPDWVKDDDVHSWQEAGSWYARCGICLVDSPGSDTKELSSTLGAGTRVRT